ncbi:hypothetical protein [Streptomyces sp. KMM 9044]|uniref:hypothetical protein n=1 Tax=Streptomyces sp. KMM 9044 TaxID=2744474 RepID=UPI0021509B83|nr:hypothetical protein [Streptomyces sp. KMM 9044]WAX77974.1 hypothetical protein HUV60_010090 [Streptomyces sp. KMM 9044]
MIEEIESGGMSTVRRGYDAVLDREIAVEIIRADVVASPAQAKDSTRRFTAPPGPARTAGSPAVPLGPERMPS